jgi:hypothetical protein
MLLAGIGLIGGMARRRKQQNAGRPIFSNAGAPMATIPYAAQ